MNRVRTWLFNLLIPVFPRKPLVPSVKTKNLNYKTGASVVAVLLVSSLTVLPAGASTLTTSQATTQYNLVVSYEKVAAATYTKVHAIVTASLTVHTHSAIAADISQALKLVTAVSSAATSAKMEAILIETESKTQGAAQAIEFAALNEASLAYTAANMATNDVASIPNTATAQWKAICKGVNK